ncbi:MAG: hypothetical protein Ct9H90mP16_06920 [Candidatus Poseidoniales archaeon]|nr:MAG: hypothetical protein Ct9H90mP16_06920 [Candidatus Poseidoniales archaeon]
MNPENPWRGFGSVELCWAFGDRISDESSLLHWAAKHRIPIIIPGLSDGSIGAQLFMHRQRSPDFMIDFLADEQILSDLTWTCEESHALMVGGGISKHHVIWWNQYRGGLWVQPLELQPHQSTMVASQVQDCVKQFRGEKSVQKHPKLPLRAMPVFCCHS